MQLLKKHKILIILICFSLLFLQVNIVRAGLDFGFEQNRNNALGVNLGFGGWGFAYRHFYTDLDGVQFTGSVSGDAEEIDYNLGVLYYRILHQSFENRFSVTPGFSLSNESLRLGSVIEVEFDPGWFRGITTAIAGGYQVHWDKSQKDYNIGLTVGLSMFYNY